MIGEINLFSFLNYIMPLLLNDLVDKIACEGTIIADSIPFKKDILKFTSNKTFFQVSPMPSLRARFRVMSILGVGMNEKP